MCEQGVRDASAWDVLCAAQRFQHRAQVSMDQSLEDLGISFAQYRIIELLTTAHDLSLSELGRRMRVTRQATMTTGKLAAAGLVHLEREADAVYVIPRIAAANDSGCSAPPLDPSFVRSRASSRVLGVLASSCSSGRPSSP
jgi:hypothetical protein